MAGSGAAIGIFTVIAGATPGQVAAGIIQHPPSWVPWVSPALVILGLAIIWVSLRYNVWSQKQKAIDTLAEDISWAISDLVNRQPILSAQPRSRQMGTRFPRLVWPSQQKTGLEGPGVQDVDRPAHVEALSQPARARRPRVQVKPSRLVPRSERLDGIVPGPLAEAGRRAEVFRPVAGTVARRRAVVPPGIPPRGRRGDGADRASRGSRAWWARPGPSGGCDGPDRTTRRSPGTGSRGRGGAARAGSPGEWSASGRRLPRSARPGRAASPPGSRRTPGGGTFPRKRACRPRGRTGPAPPGPPAPGRRRGRRPGSARPGRRDRSRGGARSPRAGPARPPAAGPSRAFPRKRPPGCWRRPCRAPADTASRAPRPAPA